MGVDFYSVWVSGKRERKKKEAESRDTIRIRNTGSHYALFAFEKSSCPPTIGLRYHELILGT